MRRATATADERSLRAVLEDAFAGGSGPEVARLFDRLFALTSLVAWISLGLEVIPLFGVRGLLPAAEWLTRMKQNGFGFLDAPAWQLFTSASDDVLRSGVIAGAALSVLAFFGCFPRVCFAASTALYLGYAVIGRTFFSFQWDNLLLECGALAVLLPRHRRGRTAHVLFRILLFKLYFESGVAKWQSPIRDWQDGSAMRFYYETAPLPTRFAHFAHNLPANWHLFESWATLALELVVPFFIFGKRKFRLAAAALLTVFQLVNIATANYGFFAYLAIVLHVFLLDESDVARARRWLSRRAAIVRRARVALGQSARSVNRRVTAIAPRLLSHGDGTRSVCLALYVTVSFGQALSHFAGAHAIAVRLEPITAFRVINTYHLFGSITRERIEPTIQTFDGQHWITHDLWHKPGDPTRAPDFIAPLQPRLDFQLWFYGLTSKRAAPEYAKNLAHRLCADPSAVQSFFREPLPEAPKGARVAFQRYTFTTRRELAATGRYWNVEPAGITLPLKCSDELPPREPEDMLIDAP